MVLFLKCIFKHLHHSYSGHKKMISVSATKNDRYTGMSTGKVKILLIDEQ